MKKLQKILTVLLIMAVVIGSYQARAVNRPTGWVNEYGVWHFYNEETHELEKNKIVGNTSGGYYYVDEEGVRTDEEVMNLAVSYIRKNTKEQWTPEKKLEICVKTMIKKHKFKELGNPDKVDAGYMRSYAKRFFTKKNGNCFCHAAAVCYIAKALGYSDVRVGKGTLSGHYTKNKKKTSKHGWAEIKKTSNKEWKIYDLTFSRRYPKKKLLNVTRKKYAYKLKTKTNFVLTIDRGYVKWE